MIGRGTRLCEGLNVVDPLDGSHENKERFFIFDWCRNFQFFKENENVSEGRMAQSLSEVIFGRQAQLVYEFQSSAYTANQWQDWRDELVDTIHYQVVSLIPEKEEDTLVSVRLHRAAVEKFKQKKAYDCIAEADLGVLKGELAPLVHNDETDIDALRFADVWLYVFPLRWAENKYVSQEAGFYIVRSAGQHNYSSSERKASSFRANHGG